MVHNNRFFGSLQPRPDVNLIQEAHDQSLGLYPFHQLNEIISALNKNGSSLFAHVRHEEHHPRRPWTRKFNGIVFKKELMADFVTQEFRDFRDFRFSSIQLTIQGIDILLI